MIIGRERIRHRSGQRRHRASDAAQTQQKLIGMGCIAIQLRFQAWQASAGRSFVVDGGLLKLADAYLEDREPADFTEASNIIFGLMRAIRPPEPGQEPPSSPDPRVVCPRCKGGGYVEGFVCDLCRGIGNVAGAAQPVEQTEVKAK